MSREGRNEGGGQQQKRKLALSQKTPCNTEVLQSSTLSPICMTGLTSDTICGLEGGLVGLLVGLAVLSFAKLSSAAEAVYSCDELLQVLLESSETGISVVGNLRCSEASDWPAEVRIARDVMIIGDTFGESQLSIPDSTTFSVVSSSFLTLSNLLLAVRTLEESMTLPFIEVTATIFTSSCLKNSVEG